MAHRFLILAFGMVAAASPLAASQADPDAPGAAPAAGPDAKYCMKVESVTGTRLETVQCWTREEWAEQGVDVDLEWAEEGVTVEG